MGKKVSSIDRVYAQFKDIDIAQISLVQMAYVNKDSNLIRKIMNKPNISDNSAFALGRLSNQYINLLSSPKQKDIDHIAKKYFVGLSTDFNDNLKYSGNRGVVFGVKTPIDIIAANGLISFTKKNTHQTTITNLGRNYQNFWNSILEIDKHKTDILNNLNYRYFRLFLKCNTQRNTDLWISTPFLMIGNSKKFKKYIDKIEDYYITQQSLYVDYHGNDEKIISIDEIKIEYR